MIRTNGQPNLLMILLSHLSARLARMRKAVRQCSATVVLLWVGAITGVSAEPAPTNAPSHDLLLNTTLGKLVVTPTNTVPRQLLPPPGTSITNQIPEPFRGMVVPEKVHERGQNQGAVPHQDHPPRQSAFAQSSNDGLRTLQRRSVKSYARLVAGPGQ